MPRESRDAGYLWDMLEAARAIRTYAGGGVVTVNDQPYLNLVLRVEDGMRAAYETNVDAIIPRTAVPQFQPGAVIPVKVDPQDPKRVVLEY